MSHKEITRREFIKGAAIGTVGVASMGILAGCGTGSASTEAATPTPTVQPTSEPVTVEVADSGGKIPSNLDEVRASRVPACMGGPILDDGDYFVIRWLGNCCWEINYRNQIILFDNFYDRGARAPETGVTADSIVRADCILISHAHKDHISDTAQVALKTGAPVYGDKITKEALMSQGLPEEQFILHDGEEWYTVDYPFDGLQVHMIHTLHNRGGRDSSGFKPAINTYTEASEETLAEEEAISSRGSSDSAIFDEGLFSFYIVFDSGFSIFASESNARGLAEGMKEYLSTLGRGVDMFFAPCQLGYDPNLDLYEKKVVDLLEAVNPRLVMGQHHDVYPDFPMTSLVPLFQWVYDNRRDRTDTYFQLYREPLVFDTVGQFGSDPLAPLAI